VLRIAASRALALTGRLRKIALPQRSFNSGELAGIFSLPFLTTIWPHIPSRIIPEIVVGSRRAMLPANLTNPVQAGATTSGRPPTLLRARHKRKPRSADVPALATLIALKQNP
jgi:hypothetical protein